MNDPYENALNFLNDIKNHLTEDEKPYLERLQQPMNIVSGEIEVKMDDGKTKRFQAYRSQHNNALGPHKGGIRFHQNVSESEVKALSLWMSIKTSIAGIPFGGGKGGVIVDPKELSDTELENLSRAYMRLIVEHIGVDKDIPAPDVNTNGQTMAWMLDEYEKIIGHHEPGVITGKPLEIGGSEGRTKATGFGGYLAMQLLRKNLKKKYSSNKDAWYHKERKDVKIAIQGFGNVGYYFALSAYEHGYTIVAVSDSKGAIYDANGLDPEAVIDTKQAHGSVTAHAGTKISNEELLELDVDVLAPSALENVIHQDNADNIKAPLILELANGPVTPEADEKMSGKDIIIVPDVFANAGGVTVSYLEWVQNRMGHYWKEDKVDDELEELMDDAFDGIWKTYIMMQEENSKATLRQATYVRAVKRIIAAEKLRRPV